ncbi:MAG: amino acid adenylation domain-containing protein [Limisphaerales bacterium]
MDRTTLLRKHYAFQQGCFVSEQESGGGGIFAFSEITPIPMWNHSAWIDEAGDFGKFIEQARTWQNVKNRRPVVYVAGPTEEEIGILSAQGFEKFDEEAWMVCEVEAVAHQKFSDVSEVQDQQTLNQFVETFFASFQTKEAGYRRALVRKQAAGPIHSRHFVLYDSARHPVSVGTLIAEGEVGCVYNVGTPAEQRKKGYGGKIFEHIAAVAKESGCKRLFLQVENNSNAKRLYEKFGFQTAFVRAGFRLKDWQSNRIQRTKLSNLLGFRPGANHTPRHLRETRALSAETSAALVKMAGPKGVEKACLGAWAYLLHRYTGEDTNPFTACDHDNDSRRQLAVTVDRFATVKSWLTNLPETTPQEGSEAAESFLCVNQKATPSHLEDHQFPLELHIIGKAESIELIFRSDLFSKDSIRRMSAHFATILEFITRHPNETVGDIELLSPGEKRQLLVEWNETNFEPTQQSLVHLFEAQVEKTPDATALWFAKAGEARPSEELTYRQLNRRANRLAHHLQDLGVGPDVFVGVCLHRSLDMIVSLLAILKAGGACVPLDPAYPSERIRFMLQDTSAPVILTQKDLHSFLRETTHARLICLDQPDQRSENEKNPTNRAPADSAAYVIYTSGSTGQPKGVVIPNHAIANHCVDCRKVYGLSARDRILQFSSFNFDASFEQILPALISGASLVVRDDEVWNTREFADKLRDLQLTVTDIPTAYWHQLATEWSHDPSAAPGSNALRLVIVGGEALSPEKLALWQQTPLGKVRLINAYGPTETIITATSYDVPTRGADDAAPEVFPIGRARGDRKLYVVDRYGNPTPVGVPGELQIGGTMLARGYHRRADLTASRFIPNPFSDEPEARLYRTGDLVRYLEDGNLEFLGRIDDQVKIRGFRIELGEIETCLCKHDSVQEAIVLARSNERGDKRLVAYITSAGERPDTAELRGFLKSRLPEYMVPHSIVILEQWPMMPNGKVDRKALPEPAEDKRDQNVKGPECPLELQLQVLFERVLKTAPIGVDASFFELGGDSLQALELLVEIEKGTGKQLPLGTLYQSSTVETLAKEIQSRAADLPWTSLVPLQTSGKRPPLFLLHTTPGDILGYGNLVYRLGPDQPCYGFQSLGLKAPELTHHSMEEMVRYYVGLLREFQPRGPYYLGGWCYGGIVAVEMARILAKEGEKIAMLALLETVAMPARWTNIRYFLHRLRCFARMSPDRWLKYFQSKARYTRESRIANKMRFRQAENSPEGEIRDPRLLKLEQVYNTNLTALNNYRTEPFNGKVTLFNAAERDAALIPDPQYGWVGLAREIEVHEVPGNHDTMLTEPNVHALAQRLNDCLLRAQNQTDHVQNQAI